MEEEKPSRECIDFNEQVNYLSYKFFKLSSATPALAGGAREI